MANWGRSRNGQVLTPRRQRLIRAYYRRRPALVDLLGIGLYAKWNTRERTAYCKWRNDFMQEDRWSRNVQSPPTARGASDGKR